MSVHFSIYELLWIPIPVQLSLCLRKLNNKSEILHTKTCLNFWRNKLWNFSPDLYKISIKYLPTTSNGRLRRGPHLTILSLRYVDVLSSRSWENFFSNCSNANLYCGSCDCPVWFIVKAPSLHGRGALEWCLTGTLCTLCMATLFCLNFDVW